MVPGQAAFQVPVGLYSIPATPTVLPGQSSDPGQCPLALSGVTSMNPASLF